MPDYGVRILSCSDIPDVSYHTVAVEIWRMYPEYLFDDRLSLARTRSRDEQTELFLPTPFTYPWILPALELAINLDAARSTEPEELL